MTAPNPIASTGSTRASTGSTRRIPARRRVIFRLAAVCFGLLLAAVIGEIGARLFDPPDCFYKFDPYVGHRLPPSSVFFDRNEGHIWVRTNSQGLRDREHEFRKPANVYRIAILGDSFAEAIQVEQDETFWSLLETKLNEAGGANGRTVEVINFGVSGYGTVQEWQTLKHYAGKYEPDLVLLAFFPGNDIRNNSSKLHTQMGTPFASPENGKLKFQPIANPIPPGGWLWFKNTPIRLSRLLRLIYRTKESIKLRRQAAKVPPATELGLDAPAFAPPRDAVWAEAWEITRLALRETRNEADQLGAKFVVTVLTNPIEVRVDPAAEETLKKYLGVEDLSYPDRRLDEIAVEFDFPIIHLAPEFRERARRDKTSFHGFPATRLGGMGHWNRDGHRLAAEILTRELAPMIQR